MQILMLRKMGMRSPVLILLLLCATEILSEVSHGHESSAGLNDTKADDSSYFDTFATKLIGIITGQKNGSQNDNMDIRQKLNYAKTVLLSEKMNAANNQTLQRNLEEKILLLEMASQLLGTKEGTIRKETVKNLNGDENFEWSSPFTITDFVTNGVMKIKDPILKQSQNHENLIKITSPPSSELFREIETTVQIPFDTNNTKDIVYKLTDINDSGILSFLGQLIPGSKANSSVSNIKNTTQKPSHKPTGNFFFLNRDQNFLGSVNNYDQKFPNTDLIFNISDLESKYMDERDTELHKHDFFNLSSSSILASGMVMNMTNQFPHHSEFGEPINSTTEISTIIYSIKDLPTVINNGNLKALYISHKINEDSGGRVFPLRNVSSNSTTFDFEKNKQPGKAQDIQYSLFNSLENTTDIGTMISFEKSNDSTLNSTEIHFKKHTPWLKNKTSSFNENREARNSFIASKMKEFQSPFDLENNTKRNSLIKNSPPITTSHSKQHSNITENDFKISQETTLQFLISPTKSQSGVNSSIIKKFSGIVIPTIFETNYTLGINNASMLDLSTHSYNNNEKKQSSVSTINDSEFLTSIEELNENDRQQSIFEKRNFEKKNNTEFTKEAQRNQKPWKNYQFSELFKVLTKVIESKQAENSEDSTVNRNMKEKSDEMVKIQTPIENPYVMNTFGHQDKPAYNTSMHAARNDESKIIATKFWNESSQSLRNEMNSFDKDHSNKIPYVFGSVMIQINKYINFDSRNPDKIDEGFIMNSRVEYNYNNETTQLITEKGSEGKNKLQ